MMTHVSLSESPRREQIRPRIDWILLTCLLVGAACLPLVILESEWVPEAERLLWTSLWSVIVGLILARTRLKGVWCWLIAIALGVLNSIQFAGQILPPFITIIQDLGKAFEWLWAAITGRAAGVAWPFYRSITQIGEQSTAFVTSITEWIATVQSGGASEENAVLWLGVSFIVWLLTINASFELHRKRRAFVAMLPLAAAILINVSFTDIGISYIQVALAMTLVILVRANIQRMEAFWARLDLDFSSEVRRDATLVGLIMSVVIVGVAIITPYMTYNKAVWAFWNRYGPTFTGFYEELDRAFAGRNPLPEPTETPKSLDPHNVAAGGVLSEDVLFSVWVSDPPPPPEQELVMLESQGIDISELVTKRYWRERTYDVYTGSGWDNSEMEDIDWEANLTWDQPAYPGQLVTQTYTLIQEMGSYGFAVNEFASAQSPYRTIARSEGDLAAYRVTGDEVTVVSYAPRPTIEQLREAEGRYPAWLADRYLELPRIPNSVENLAEEIVSTAGATTRYDMAKAIEAHIRDFAYDLEIEPPPLDADIVEYFLFEAQRGYCDYSATAMVVMLRSQGVAARYASGFNMGLWNEEMGEWIVRASNAHAWVEVYFPELGWVEFEPTPSQRVFVRPTGGTFEGGDESDIGENKEPEAMPSIYLYAAGLAALIAVVVIWPFKYFDPKRLPPEQQVQRCYRKLTRRARWSRLSPMDGQTVREYLTGLAKAIERRIDSSGAATNDISVIADGYQRARYAEAEIDTEALADVISAWKRLAPKLTRLMFTSDKTERGTLSAEAQRSEGAE